MDDAGSMLNRWGDHSMFAFDEIIRGDGGLYVRNTTIVKPHPFPLIAGSFKLIEDEVGQLSSMLLLF